MTIILYLLKIIINIIFILVLLLIIVIFLTLLERHIIGNIQRRQGPIVNSFFGIGQAVLDGIKLFFKEIIIPTESSRKLFILCTILTMLLGFLSWSIFPFLNTNKTSFLDYGLLYILGISSLHIYTIIFAGWSSNSKYSMLGAVRAAAQMLSYELILSLIFAIIYLYTGSLNLREIVIFQQECCWLGFPLSFCVIIYFICLLAETNRHPFDLPEAESELVSGYNTEYSGFLYSLFAIGEYLNVLFMLSLLTICFLGGGEILPVTLNLEYYLSDSLFRYYYSIPDWIKNFIFAMKLLFCVIIFYTIRGALPRYRYDQIMNFGWKILLPFILILFIYEVIYHICF